MNRPVAVLFCPGRGAYTRDELGSLTRALRPAGPVAKALADADRQREDQGQMTITALDQAERFQPRLHLDAENAAALIYFATLAHVESLDEQYEIVAVAGNSLGWYTALPASGALTVAEGWRLVSTMARLQKTVASGGQVITTVVDDQWLFDHDASRAIVETLATCNADGPEFFAARSIRLGGHEVLAGTESAVARMLEQLPKRKIGEREFPFRLAGHGPFHSELCRSVAEQAIVELSGLHLTRPHTHLIDGLGSIHSPWSCDPQELLQYTIKQQVVETFDFTACVRVGIREFNPDVLLCSPPGNSLRAPVGHIVLTEGYHGIRSKQQLFDAGLVVS